MLHFYGKPVCQTNRHQLALLKRAGVEVQVHDLLTTAWTPLTLQPYLSARPVHEWFNPSAVAVKQGDIDPYAFDAEQALIILSNDAALIRRPLIRIEDTAGMTHTCGFDRAALEARLGVCFETGLKETERENEKDDEACSHTAASHAD